MPAQEISATGPAPEADNSSGSCSREWPCDKCQGRKVPQLCRFGETKDERGDAAFAKGSRKRKGETSDQLDDDYELEAALVLRELGFMPDHHHFTLGFPALSDDANANPKQELKRVEQALLVSTVLADLNPLFATRETIDALIQNFFQGPNYHYYMLFPPLFTQAYTAWWENKSLGRDLEPAFTSLLLRACAISLQFLKETMRPKIVATLGSPQELTEKLHEMACKLNDSMEPGEGGLWQVLQLLHTSWWYKSETRFKESWHALAATYLAAQELGMDRDSAGQDLSEFDTEMRRRVWCLLYLWDWQMSGLLGRPRLINPSQCRLVIPTRHLESLDDDRPSPYQHIVLSIDLAKAISKRAGIVEGAMTAQMIANFVQGVQEWMTETLTGVYAIDESDTNWDGEHRYVVWQRKQLHLIAYLTGLIPIKKYLIHEPQTMSSSGSGNGESGDGDGIDLVTAIQLRATAVEWCLRLIKVSQDLFDLVFPEYAKYHFSLFCVFDAVATLCAAVSHDQRRTLPRRDEILSAIAGGVEMMWYLRSYTNVGEMSYNILTNLVKKLPLTPEERSANLLGPSAKRPRTRGSSVVSEPSGEEADPSSSTSAAAAMYSTTAATPPMALPTLPGLSQPVATATTVAAPETAADLAGAAHVSVATMQVGLAFVPPSDNPDLHSASGIQNAAPQYHHSSGGNNSNGSMASGNHATGNHANGSHINDNGIDGHNGNGDGNGNDGNDGNTGWQWPPPSEGPPLLPQDLTAATMGNFHYIFDWRTLDVVPTDYVPPPNMLPPPQQDMGLPALPGPQEPQAVEDVDDVAAEAAAAVAAAAAAEPLVMTSMAQHGVALPASTRAVLPPPVSSGSMPSVPSNAMPPSSAGPMPPGYGIESTRAPDMYPPHSHP